MCRVLYLPCRELGWPTMKDHLELVAPDLHDSLVRKLDLMFVYFAIMGLVNRSGKCEWVHG